MLSKGLTQARQNGLYLVAEDKFMLVNARGETVRRTDVGSDGNGLTTPQNWVSMLADGDNLVDATALVGEEGLISRNFMPKYRLMEFLWRGVAGLPTRDVLIDGGTRREIQWVDPEYGSPAIETYNGYYGIPEQAYRLTGGKVRSFNIDVRRGADGGSVSGQIEFHFNSVFPGVVIPRASVHSAKYRFATNGSTVNGTFKVAISDGSAGTGQQQTIATNSLYTGGAVSLSYPGNATAQTFSPGDTLAAIRAKLETLIGAAANAVTLTGTTTALSGVQNPTVAPTFGNQAVWAGPSGVYKVGYTWYDASNNETLLSPTANVTLTNGSNVGTGLTFPAVPVGAVGAQFYVETAPGSGVLRKSVGGTQSVGQGGTIQNFSTPPLTSAALPPTSNAAGSPGVLNLTATLPAGVDYAQFVANSPGVTTAITLPYSYPGYSNYAVTLTPAMTAAQIKTAFEAISGLTVSVSAAASAKSFEVTVLTPANKNIDIAKLTGNRWRVTALALGSSVVAVSLYDSPNLLASHWRSYIAINDADLASIDIFNLPDEGTSDGDAHLIEDCTSDNFSMADLWKVHYTGNALLHANDFVAGARTVAGSVSVPNDLTAGSDLDFLIKLQEGCTSPGFWKRRAFTCGSYEYIEDVYWKRNDAAGFDVDNDVWMRSVPLIRGRNPEGSGSVKITLRLPVL